MSSAHEKVQCKHGTVVSQCRCASPSKLVVIVRCPDNCPSKNEQAV